MCACVRACTLSVYQKAPDDKLIRVQGEAGLRVWHQPVGRPGQGRMGQPLVSDSDVATHRRQKAVYVLRMENEKLLRELPKQAPSPSLWSSHLRTVFQNRKSK